MQTPQLQIYNYVFEKLQGYGVPVISVKDINEVLPYPFYMVQRNNHSKALDTFDTYSGAVDLMIHVYSLSDDEVKHDDVVDYADRIVSSSFNLDGYRAVSSSVNTVTMIDNTTNDELLHTVITATFKVFIRS